MFTSSYTLQSFYFGHDRRFVFKVNVIYKSCNENTIININVWHYVSIHHPLFPTRAWNDRWSRAWCYNWDGITTTDCRHWPVLILHDDVIKWKHFRVAGPFCGEFTGHRWIPLTKASDAGFWVNNRDASDFRRHRTHYDVTVMKSSTFQLRTRLVYLACLDSKQVTFEHK